MFYSQFILAKKGPLGTIWIAAHLERKLRKNQVADTDIGVSVDSILFPEAPIALRLSSHLLLGVVRIYSRKVNYLFHDCSEALLKVKQAFRSTAVDLPPEESTAPYHSITVPETFHLDDFELPDSAYGNYVDHHISTKEQITLQDNMNTTGCSTSQFGLDERFGDGDASHIGLDLEEDLLLGTAPTPHCALDSFGSEQGAIHQDLPSVSVIDMDIDESQIVYDEGCGDATPKDFSGFASNDNDKHIHSCTADSKEHDGTLHRHGYNPRTPDLNVVFTPDIPIEDSSYNVPLSFGADDVASPDIAEFAQAPSTPGLMEEVIPANYQEMPTTSPQQKPLPSSNVDAETPLTTCPQCPNATQSNELLHAVCSPTSLLSGPCGPVLARDDTHPEFGQKSPDSLQNGFICNERSSLQTAVQVLDNGEATPSLSTGLDGFLSNSCSLEASDMVKTLDKCLDTPDQVVQTSDLPNASKLVLEEASKINGTTLSDEAGELIPAVELIPNSENCLQEADPCPVTTNTSALSSGILSLQDRALVGNTTDISIGEPSSHKETPKGPVLHVHGSSTDLEGGESPSANVIDGGLGVHANTDNALLERNLGDSKQDDQSTVVVSKEAHLDHLNCSSSSEFPEPEKMVLAPIGDMSFPNDLGQLTTEKGVTESDGSVDRINKVSGRKRHLTESTPVLQTCSSAKLPGRPRLKRNSEYVPDDDDLLASILVGRRTALRMGPTPPALKVSSLKRPRLTPKVGMSKRKVQLDDSTVLHADAIRQQLINTEDIRRIRKKAPCTRPEIWMIEQCSREEEIFDECLLTGISASICNLHTRSYVIDVIRGSQGESHSHVEQAEGAEHLISSEFAREVDREKEGEQAELQSNKLDIQISRNNGNFTLSAMEMDEMHKKNSGLDMSLFPAPHLENEPVASPNGVITGASNHRNITNDSCPEKDDDIYKQAEQSSGQHLDNPLDESMELNDRTIHLCESLPSEAAISAEGTARDRVVDDISVSSGNDKNLVSAEVLNDARGISTIEESRGQIFDEAVRLDHHQGFHSIVENTENGGTMLDNSLLDIRFSSPDLLVETFQLDPPTTITDNQLIEETKQVHLDVTVDDELAMEKVTNNEEGSPSEIVCSESIQVVASVCVEASTEIENVPSAVGENSGLQEFCQEGGVVVESTPMDFGVAREFSDFSSAIDGNDTDFLNVDDEADFDEADIDVPNPEETQSLENSGWSSRTRGVARYLKSLFDDEYGRGKKVVAMDNLISGKTRKEASRMFFETLVLKTRDYIDVEQEKPLDYINIKPRTKLLKTEF